LLNVSLQIANKLGNIKKTALSTTQLMDIQSEVSYKVQRDGSIIVKKFKINKKCKL
jgi:hypothetical protein